MSVKIIGKKLLDVGSYNRIVIREQKEGYIVNVSGKMPTYPTIKTYCSLSNNLKDKSDSEKIIELVDYFLRNNTINLVMNRGCIPYYCELFNVIKGHSELDLKLRSEELMCIPEMIRQKYLQDRISFMEDNKDVKTFNLYRAAYTAYDKVEDDEEEEISFNFLTNRDGSLIPSEKKFLEEFIFDKFFRGEQPTSLEYKSILYRPFNRYTYSGYYLTNDNVKVGIFNEQLFEEVDGIVDKYAAESDKFKEKQLKLEGI